MAEGKHLTREDFDYWLANMDDALDEFLATLPSAIRSHLDYSIPSLSYIEGWILENWPSTRAMLPQEEAHRVGGAARYIGETIRKKVGGYWDIDLVNQNNAYFGLPVVTGFSTPPSPECPLTLATASADRRTGKYLIMVVENMKRRYGSKQF